MSAKPDISVRAGSSDAPLRPISFGDPAVTIERRDNGTIYLKPKIALGEYPVRLTDRLHHWARLEPNRIFMAERDGGRGWRQIIYAELLTASRHIASSLLARGLSAEEAVLERIERLTEGDYLELQARRTRPGWTSWGDELEFTGVAA